jgi:hypothetical protein
VDSKARVLVCAEAGGTDDEGGVFPEIPDNLQKTMAEISGKETPRKKAVVRTPTIHLKRICGRRKQER